VTLLCDEYGFPGGSTIVKAYVCEHQRRSREMFGPEHHAPGHAQADFDEALVVIGGIERKAHFFVFDLPHSIPTTPGPSCGAKSFAPR